MNEIASITNWFKEAVPTPTHDNVRVQVGVHLEETSEMLTAVGLRRNAIQLGEVAMMLKTNQLDIRTIDRVELLDSLCDQIVTAIGVAHMLGMDISGALQEVDRSNWSKFVDGKAQFNDHGKIIKGPNYSAPALGAFAG